MRWCRQLTGANLAKQWQKIVDLVVQFLAIDFFNQVHENEERRNYSILSLVRRLLFESVINITSNVLIVWFCAVVSTIIFEISTTRSKLPSQNSCNLFEWNFCIFSAVNEWFRIDNIQFFFRGRSVEILDKGLYPRYMFNSDCDISKFYVTSNYHWYSKSV